MEKRFSEMTEPERYQAIEGTLKRFANGSDLREACMSLLDVYEIKYTQISPAILPVRKFFLPKFIDSNSDLIEKLDVVSVVGIASQKTFEGKEKTVITDEEMENQLSLDHYKEMAFFCIDVKSSLTRTEISALSRALNKRMKTRPVVLFVRCGDLLTMTTCEKLPYVQPGHVGEKVGKVTILRNIDCGNPHRGHVNILSSLDISSCNSFDEVYANWLETFSSELLTKKFYKELSIWYAWAIDEVRFPNDLDDPNDDAKFNHENTIRLVTRLIFVWFLREKHLIPEEFFDEAYIRENLIEDFDPNTKVDLFFKSTESKYYKAILQNLFFAMLNCPVVDKTTGDKFARRFRDAHGDRDNYKVMRYERFFKDPSLFVSLANNRVPFLNGGLFDCLDDKSKKVYYDAFSDREEISSKLVVPDYLFFGDQVGKDVDVSDFFGDDSLKHESVRGIIDILKRYHFTIEESTPYEQEVSLDPELLGKVFENLLASYNPETRSTARKQTGSFYTPRDIVQYMVDESIVQYLCRSVGPDLESRYRDLLSYATEEVELTPDQKHAVLKSLYQCKVLDPACGSGAFPVGILQQMVHILSRIDPTNEEWKELMIDEALKKSREAYNADDVEERRERLAEIEANFNEHLNYPDYARKLYLIENCVYGIDIQPIAIQISHLRFFISLIVDQKENSDPLKNFGIRPLPNLESKFVAANSLITLEKKDDIFSSSEIIKSMENSLHEANHQIFTAKSPQKKTAWRKILAERRQQLADKMVELNYVSESAGAKIASWNMFDQNSSAGFFDSEWMFGITDGFDIVIGNPPYVRRTSLSDSDKVVYESLYQSAKKQYDLYLLFIEKGLKELCKDGCLCYINPIRFFNSDYGEACRRFIVEGYSIVSIMDVSQLPVFENAMTYPCVMMIKNTIKEGNEIVYLHPDHLSKVLNTDDVEQIRFPQSSFKTDNYLFVIPKDTKTSNIIGKIDSSVRKISDSFSVARGLANKLVNFEGTGVLAIKSKAVDRYSIIGDEIEIATDHAAKFADEMVIMPRTVLYLKSACKRPGLVLLDRIYYLIPNAEEHVDYRFLVGVINSKVTNFWFEYYYSSTKVSGNYFDLNGNQIRSIHIPDADSNSVMRISKMVSILMNEDITQEERDGLDNEINACVCRLYGLSYEELKIVDPSTSITEQDYETLI